MPDVEHRPRLVRLQMLPVFSMLLCPSIRTRLESSLSSHRTWLVQGLVMVLVRILQAVRSLQQLCHWTPYLGQRSMNAIFIAFEYGRDQLLGLGKQAGRFKLSLRV